MIWNAFLLALREIRNNLLRAGLTTLGIVIGVGAVILMVTLGAGATKRVTADIGSLGNNMLLVIPGQQRGPPTAVVAVRHGDGRRDPARRAGPRRGRARARRAGRRRERQPQSRHPDQRHDQCLSDQPRLGSERRAAISRPPNSWAASPSASWARRCARSCSATRMPIGARLRINKVTCEIIGFLAPKGESIFGQDMDDIILMPLKAVQRRLAGNTEVNVIRISVAEESDDPRRQGPDRAADARAPPHPARTGRRFRPSRT